MTTHSRRAPPLVATAALVLPGTVLVLRASAQSTTARARQPPRRGGCARPPRWRRRTARPAPKPATPTATRRCLPRRGPWTPREPTRVVGKGTAASCTSKRVVKAVRRGGLITFSCGPKHVTIKMKKTAKVRNDRRAVTVIDGGGKVTLSGRRQAARDLHEHLRPRPGHHVVALPGPEDAAADLAEPHDHSRRLDRAAQGRRRRRRGLRTRRPPEGCELAVLQEPVRLDRPRPRRRGDPRARPVPRQAGLHRAQHVRRGQGIRRPMLQRWRAEQHRRLVGDPQQRHQPQQGGRERREPGATRQPGRRERGRHLHRRQPVHGHPRGHPDEPQPCAGGRRRHLLREQRPQRHAHASTTPCCARTPATASRRPAIRASSSSGRDTPTSRARSFDKAAIEVRVRPMVTRVQAPAGQHSDRCSWRDTAPGPPLGTTRSPTRPADPTWTRLRRTDPAP